MRRDAARHMLEILSSALDQSEARTTLLDHFQKWYSLIVSDWFKPRRGPAPLDRDNQSKP